MNKIPCIFQNMEAKILPSDVCIFGYLGQLSPAAVHSADSRLHSGVKWWIHISPIVMYLHKNSFVLHWNSCKQHSESSTRCYWLTVSKCFIHFEHSFLIDKFSGKMVNILPSDMFNSSVVPRNFNLWLAKTSLWSFFGVFGWPECSALFVSVWPYLKSSYHLLTIISNGAESK